MKKTRIICALLSLALIFSAVCSLASCEKKSEVIMSMSDGEISKSIDKSTYTFLLSRMRGTLDYYGYDVDDASFWRTVISKDNRTWDDHFSDTIFEQTKLYLTIEYLFEKEGLTLDAERAEKVEKTISGMIAVKGSRAALNAELKAFGVNCDMLYDIYLTEQKFSQLITHLYGENGEKIDKTVKDKFFSENYVAFGQIFLPTYTLVTGADGSESAEFFDAEKKAEVLALAKEYANSCSGRLERFYEYSELYSGLDHSGEPTYLFVESEYYAMQSESAAYLDVIAETLSEMAVGECQVIASTYGYHVICRYEREDGAYDNEGYKESFSDFYAMLSDKLFDEKCESFAELITLSDNVTLPRISSVATNKLY